MFTFVTNVPVILRYDVCFDPSNITGPQVMSIVGILADDADPMVSVMKVEKAPLESYADIGGLQDQVLMRNIQISEYFE